MTGLLTLFLFNMGLMFSGFNTQIIPTLETGTVETGIVETGVIIPSQHDIIVEDYFTFAERFPRINYARGCVGGYEKGAYKSGVLYHCGKATFDCAGLMKAYGFVKGLLTQQELSLYNSTQLYALGTPKDPRKAERGDFTYRKGHGKNETGNNSTHFAIISRGYSGGTIGIFDYTKNIPKERILKVACNKDYCSYAGLFRIYVATNGYEELAKQQGKAIEPFQIIDQPIQETGTVDTGVILYCKLNPSNPNNRAIRIKGYPYNSLANEISNFWYEGTSGDVDMITTYMGEAHFNKDAIGKAGERGMCQLMPNATNNIRINDPRWRDPMRQAKICMEKWKAVKDKKLRSAYNTRYLEKKNVLSI